jgi:galactose mutarotase-like enzyme
VERLEDAEVRVTIIPGKGADIVELVHKPSGVDPLFKAPWGLQPPGSRPREGSAGVEFLSNYEGGWQELFPNVNEAAVHRGRTIPFHGEVATLPWSVRRISDRALHCSVRCRQTPFRLERPMRLEKGALVLEETVTNESDEPAHFVWGHHCVLGPPFLEGGCRLHVPARRIVTLSELWENTARLEPGQSEPWPRARLRSGGTVDLSIVPGPEAASHDDVYLGELEDGWAVVENPRIGLAFRLEWDPRVFRWIVSWQPYGGAVEKPLGGSYALGVEPWVTRLNLEQAVAEGESIELDGGASFSTAVRAGFETS